MRRPATSTGPDPFFSPVSVRRSQGNTNPLLSDILVITGPPLVDIPEQSGSDESKTKSSPSSLLRTNGPLCDPSSDPMNQTLRPSPHTTSSPDRHSRACANCARAKAKCISNLGGAKCGRCDRLKKDCQPAIPIRKPKTARKPATNSTARLEEKLDGLFSLLKSQPSAHASAQPTVQSSNQPTITPASTQSETPEGSHLQDTPGANSGITRVAEASTLSCHHSFCATFSAGAFRSEFPPSPDARNGRLFEAAYEKCVGVDPPASFQARRSALPSSASTACHSPNNTTSSYPYPSPDDANALLSFFARQMLPYFPFMTMPPHSNSLAFRRAHPFLFLCIIAVASKSTEQQVAIGKEIRWILGRKMLVESERSLDLLQGLLVYSGWLVALFLPSFMLLELLHSSFPSFAISLFVLRRSLSLYDVHHAAVVLMSLMCVLILSRKCAKLTVSLGRRLTSMQTP
jgi:hypothetical protein